MSLKKVVQLILRIMLIAICIVYCVPIASDFLHSRVAAQPSRTPNIVLIIADDLGIDAHPCYPVGKEKPNAPTLTALCQQGVVFENAWVYPVCTPTRAAILTGKYGFRTKVGGVGDLLSTEETSIQRVLSQAPTPYKNAVIGKWHVGGHEPDPNHPRQLGIDFYSGFMDGMVSDYANWQGVEQGKPFQSKTYTTTAFTDKAIAWVKQQQQPWFLWLAYNAPHAPFHSPPVQLRSQTQLPEDPQVIRQNPRPNYFAAIEAMDREIGRFLTTMSPETRQNTVVIFIGDNGSPRPVVQSPFTRASAKGTVKEGGVRVPFVVAGAGVTRSNAREPALVTGTDLFATIAAIANIQSPTGKDSVSFKDALTSDRFQGRSLAYTEFFNPSINQWAIRNSQYKLIHNVTTGEESLYDLKTDLAEQQNLLIASENAKKIASQLRESARQLRS
jgi:arylsulfatase A-like enzyme